MLVERKSNLSTSREVVFLTRLTIRRVKYTLHGLGILPAYKYTLTNAFFFNEGKKMKKMEIQRQRPSEAWQCGQFFSSQYTLEQTIPAT